LQLDLKPIYLIIIVACFYSCGIDKYIPKGERLYTGSSIKISSDSLIEGEKYLKAELETALTPEPNTTFLGMRPGLHYYYKVQKEKPSFITRWLYKQIGEEPVYQSDVQIYEVQEVLLNQLENSGFFYSRASSNFKETEQEASITYNLKVPKPYRMVKYRTDTLPTPIDQTIEDAVSKTELIKGMRFDLGNMKLERQRIDANLKERGYYNFNSDFLIFEADTNQYSNKQFDLFLKLKKDVPNRALLPYKLTKVNVFPNYEGNDSTLTRSERLDAKNYIQDTVFFRPDRLNPFITLKEGQLYNPQTSKNTARRLATIGAYKYVNIQYKEIDSTLGDGSGALEANIYLSPLTKRAIRAELQAVTTSNNFAGPNLALTYSNRNLFKGGEIFSVTANMGYEIQVSGGNSTGLSSLVLGLKGELIFPRVISPFKINEGLFKYSVPKTKTSLGVDYLRRSELYELLSGSALFGYNWNSNRYITYNINPISINYTSLSNTTQEFDDILAENPFLRQSFEQAFIAGLTFSFNYNGMVDINSPNQFALKSTLDVAGNTISLFGKEGTPGDPKTFLGLEYAQYAKADIDLRFHNNFGKNRGQTLATRLFAGYGLAYGNSEILPFVKQFSSGGPYSVRAFRIRSLGPGTYNPNTDGNADDTFFDQTGNIRLEANIEYRFPVYSFLKGALFADAGNVWNSKANPIFDGKDVFTSNFINELGMGVGAGLRIDLQGFVIRFDLAAPFHDPSLPEGERFDFKFDKPILNFAIGYSF
jgi:outer membrane protein insertion porin family